jgi:hypothetical protein
LSNQFHIGFDPGSPCDSFQSTALIFIGKCPRCGTVNDVRGVMHGDEPGGRLEMPRDIKCFNCGLGGNTLIVDERINAKGEYEFDSAQLWFVDFCQCSCHTEKGARCGFVACCRHAGELYAEKWPTLPVVEEDSCGKQG